MWNHVHISATLQCIAHFLFISFLRFSFFPCFSKWILLVHCIRCSLLSCHVQFSKWILNVLKRTFLHVCYVLNLIWEWGSTALTWNVDSGTDGYKENILNCAVNVLLVLEQNSSVLLSYKRCFVPCPPESLYLKWLLWCVRLAYIGLHDARSHAYKHNTYICKWGHYMWLPVFSCEPMTSLSSYGCQWFWKSSPSLCDLGKTSLWLSVLVE